MLFIFMLCLCLLTHSLFISFFISIMHSAFNLFVFPNYMFTSLLLCFFVCVCVCVVLLCCFFIDIFMKGL